MRHVRNSALGVGIASGVIFYAFIRLALQVTPPWIALDLIAAFGGGLLLGVGFYLFCKRVLRRVAGRFRAEVAPLAGVTLPPMRVDELEELHQTYERAVAALARHDRYRAITDQLLASDDLGAAFRVIAEHAAGSLPIDGALLFIREGALARPAATWNMDGEPLPEPEKDCAIWRALHENRPLLVNHAATLGDGAGVQAAALLVVPLDVADRPAGVLALINRTNPIAFDDDDLEPARFFAGQAAIAVRQAQLSGAARTAEGRLAALCQISRDLGSSAGLDDLLQRVLGAAAALTSSRHATVMLLDELGDQITYRVALHSGNMAPLEMVARPIMRQGLAGWVVRERQAALVLDTEQDSRWLPGPGLGDIRSALVAPLLQPDRALGIITLAHDAPGHYTKDHLQLLEALGAQAALAIENIRRSGDEHELELGRAQVAPARDIIADAHPADVKPVRHDTSAPEAAEQPSAHEIVAVYADMHGFSRASERLAPEIVVKEILDVYFQTMTEAIRRYEGDVDKRFGDGVLALFGHPESRSDDALRALQAAHAMRQAAVRLRARWRIRLGIDIGIGVGVARGRVVVSRVGSLERHDYTVIGDAINLAGQLQGLARTGEVLAAAEVIEALNGTGASFQAEALPPLQIKGQSRLRRIYRIGEPSAVSRPSPGSPGG
jgi:class 3 adenylate cyclase